MTATDELRRLLDERGVEWCEPVQMEGSIFTRWNSDGVSWTASMVHGRNNALRIGASAVTPEQAIAATLGSGTCTVTHDFNCSNCGKQIGVVRNCEMYETCDGRQAWKSLDHEVCDVPNYCPNCGAKVVDE